MIYVFINLILAAYLIWFSLNINTKTVRNENSLINIVLLVTGGAIIMAGTVSSILWGPENFSIFLEHLVLFFIALILIVVSFYFLSYLSEKNIGVLSVLQFMFIALAFYISVFKIKVVDYTRFEIAGEQIFSGLLASYFPITWVGLYYGSFVFFVPGFCMLLMLMYTENTASRIAFQRSLWYLGCMLLSWTGLIMIMSISGMLPMMKTLIFLVFALMAAVMVKSATMDKIYDVPTMISSILVLAVKFALPAIVGSILFVMLRPIYYTSHAFYITIVTVITIFIMELATLLTSYASKFSNFRSAQYDTEVESALAEMNYEGEQVEICNQLLNIFREKVGVKDMMVLIDNGNGELETTFSSSGERCTIPLKNKGLDALLDNDHPVCFKEDTVSNVLLMEFRSDINALFAEADAEAMIILREGRHIMGIIFLSEKSSGNTYDEYDKIAFNNLYSNFFVFGYYMSNIANAAVVGTVNREIKMSAQIITSIQENMDPIENPKIDTGYLMVPAHNIGGEFIDFIRLTDTRHIAVVGSLSGKGISASMSMVILKSIIRTNLADTHDFKTLVAKINKFIRFNLPKGTFFAGVFCLLDFETDTMYYINCGIPTLLLYTRAYNNVIEIQGSGYVLGFVKDITPLLKVKQIHLNAGDIIAASTAGLINSHSLRGEQYGKDRIKQAMTDNYMYKANRMVNFTFDNLKKFMAKELEDDITLMIFRYLGKDNVTLQDEESSEAVEETPAEVV